ncbi:LAMI_0E01112g1_1 [Lachancea mirantina]|uniref:LAMI_0E01112g1_1 n=1 Tax=Lachancea mirantina TaxID=1230905 RepID=A0A1G4JIL2_9SACH|nr:LAMI_0E01112g1_1 [Lachancea mirantina]
MHLLNIVIFLLVGFDSFVLGIRNVIEPKPKTTSSEEIRPWMRTIYSTVKEVVTPTVIAGVTFSRKPLATPDPLEPWVSLNKEGLPKTIKPKIKNGRTENASPTYSTYFKTVSTKTFDYEELQAHNMDPNDVYEEEVFEDEDKTYVSLNPIIRCTPDRYLNKGLAKNVPSEPFCTPRENSELKVGKTYFVTWYTNFFRSELTDETAEKVRIHLSYVREKSHEKGFGKRDMRATFFSSEWIRNVDGLYPLEIYEEWLNGKYERKVVLSVQPSTIPDDEFNHLEHGLLINIALGSRVFKKTKEQLALEDAGIMDDTWYYVALSIPTAVLIACVGMYFFLYLNRHNRDISDVRRFALSKRRRVIGKFKDMKKYKNINNRRYDELPSYNKKNSKQS